MAENMPRPFGSYTLLRRLARGGMGEIFLARSSGYARFEKYYAVKKLRRRFAHSTDVVSRFIDEARLGASLNHPNIVQVFDLGNVDDELYMAAEFVDGFDLRRVLRFCRERQVRIPTAVALFVTREILSGLAYAHRQEDSDGHCIELVHRDISPQNVLLSFEGEVKIIDFGLAKSTRRSEQTKANVVLGNLGYMSPEQAQGAALDARTDVYSTAIVLFELLTGSKRFQERRTMSLLEQVAYPEPLQPSERNPEILPQIDELYTCAAHAERASRFADAAAFRDAVTQVMHALHPSTSREQVASFLADLFEVPRTGWSKSDEIDPAIDRSVALRVSRSWPREPSEEEELQTASHPAMRAVTVGQHLPEDVLLDRSPVGEAGTAGDPTPAPKMVPLPVSEAFQDRTTEEHYRHSFSTLDDRPCPPVEAVSTDAVAAPDAVAGDGYGFEDHEQLTLPGTPLPAVPDQAEAGRMDTSREEPDPDEWESDKTSDVSPPVGVEAPTRPKQPPR